MCVPHIYVTIHDVLFSEIFTFTVRRRGVTMEVSYKKLWKLLIDKDMKKKDLQALSGISWSSMTKLSKGETVSMEILMKICQVLKCDIGDIMELLPVEKEAND